MQNQINTQVNTEFRRNNRPLNVKNLDDMASIFNYLLLTKSPRSKYSAPSMSTTCKIANDPMLPAIAYLTKPANYITSKMAWSSICRIRSPVFSGKWLRDGIHLVTGSSNGDISLLNPFTYTQELSFPGHECSVRAIAVSHDGNWVISADHNGQIKYWQPNLNMISTFAAHTDPIRDICFSPTDAKFASCSDDGLIKVWDFEKVQCDCAMQGHGSDVKCLDWHPSKGLVLSGSKDCQQPIMLWDPRTASPFCTIHTHKNAIMSIKWNNTGNLFASASKDKTIKIFDIRVMNELQTFKGHKREVYHVCWHTISDIFLSSGGVDGSLFYWLVGDEKEVGSVENAHDGVIWEVDWHPEGHILASMSNDQASKIWVRSQPGDKLPSQNNMNIFSATTHEEDVLMEKDNTDICEKNFLPNYTSAIPGLSYSKSNTVLPSPILTPIANKPKIQEVSKYFTCAFTKSSHSKSHKKDRYPIGKYPKPVIPTEAQIEEEEKYLYDEKYTNSMFDQPIEYIDIYEEEEEAVPAQFSNSSKDLNFINEECMMDILDVIRSYKNYRTDYQRADQDNSRRERSRNSRQVDSFRRDR